MDVKLVLDNPTILTALFESISKIIDEGILQFTNEGLKLVALDKNNIIFVNLKIGCEGLTEYICKQDTNIGVDMEELIKYLKRGRKDDMLEIRVKDPLMELEYTGELRRTFTLKTFEILHESPEPPTLDYPSQFIIPTKILTDSVNDCDLNSDKLTCSVKEEKLTIHAEGEYGCSIIEYLLDDKQDRCKSILTTAYLKNILKSGKIFDDVTVNLGNDMPLQLDMNNTEYDVKLGYLLAPRIEVED